MTPNQRTEAERAIAETILPHVGYTLTTTDEMLLVIEDVPGLIKELASLNNLFNEGGEELRVPNPTKPDLPKLRELAKKIREHEDSTPPDETTNTPKGEVR